MKLNCKNPLLAASALLILSAPVVFAQNRYWDNNGATTAFGTNSTGTWAAPTTGNATQNWSSNATGTGALANYTTLITDTVHFGTDTSPNGVGGGTITVSGTVNALAMRFGNQTTSNITFSGGTINLGAATNVSVGAGSTTLMTINSNITGAATSFTKNGNSLTLGGTNTYAGRTIVTAGRLQFAKTASLYNSTDTSWTAANLNVASGGTLAFNVGGTGEFTTGNVTTLLTNLAASSGATNGMLAGSNFGFDTTNASGATFTIADAINNSTGGTGGARGLTKLGTNTLILGTANGYTGTTTIAGGTLRLADVNAAASSSSLAFSIASGNVLQIGTDTAFVAANLSSISAGFNNSGTTNIVSDRATTGAGLTHALGALSIGNTQMNITAGSNVTSGTAEISFTSVGMSSATTAQATTFNPTTANMIVVGAVTGSASAGTHTLALGGTSTGNSIGGVIGNGGRTTQNLSKSDTSTWNLSGTNNTYTGTTTINRGTLRINSIDDYNAPSSIGAPTGGDLVIGSANTGVLDYVGAGDSTNRTIMMGSSTAAHGGGAFILANGGAALTFTAATLNNVQSAANVTRTLTLGGAGIGAIAGKIQDNNTGNGKVAVTKQDAGTWTLGGSNDYTGTTTVTAGSLIINGAVASTSVVVNSSLGGSGTMAAATLSGSGSIDPGNSPGILAAASVDPIGGLDFNFEFTSANTQPTWSNSAASGNDVMRLTGGTPFLTALGGTNVMNIFLNVGSLAEGDIFTGGFYTDQNSDFISHVSNAATQYYLADLSGSTTYGGIKYSAYTGPYAFVVATAPVASANFASGTVTNGFTTQFTVIPEPNVAALFGSLGAFALLRRRRH